MMKAAEHFCRDKFSRVRENGEVKRLYLDWENAASKKFYVEKLGYQEADEDHDVWLKYNKNEDLTTLFKDLV